MTALMLFTLAWITGILISQVVLVPLPWLLLAVPIALVLLVGWGDSRWSRRGAAMLIALLLGAGRLVLAQPQIDENHIAFYNDRDDILLEGVLDGELDIRFNHTLARMKATSITFKMAKNKMSTATCWSHCHHMAMPNMEIASLLKDVLKPRQYSTLFPIKNTWLIQGIYAVFDAKSYTILASHQANMVKDLYPALQSLCAQDHPEFVPRTTSRIIIRNSFGH